MPRPWREEDAGAIHHVIPQGNRRGPIVLDDRDRRSYLVRYMRVRRELGWTEHAGCLMDTHHHTVVETPEPNLARGMQRLLGGHSRWFNARHGREGQLFRHRFWSRRIDDAWLFRACIYAVVNPVAARVCAHPRDWPWCTYAMTAEGDSDSFAPGEERLLRMFGDSPVEARRCYAEVVDAAVELLHARNLREGKSTWRALAEFETFASAKVSG